MGRSGVFAIFLIILILLCCTAHALALESDEPAVQESIQPAELASGIFEDSSSEEIQEPDAKDDPVATDTPDESADPSPSPAAVPSESAEPDAEDSAEPPLPAGPSDEPALEPMQTPQPTDPAPTASPSIQHEAPSLEAASGQTIYLNQETPSIKVRWKSGVPDNVAGYVWSYKSGSSDGHVFYVTYDPGATVLAAGALNGHISTAGTYVITCQPVDSAQEPATGAADLPLYVEQSTCELTISADRGFPVAAGSSLSLTADAGNLSDEVTRYEWKPSGNGAGRKTCKISEVAAGPVRYTCTAVLESGQRITGAIVVTGTELIAAQRCVTLTDTGTDLSVAWSNGAPSGDIHYDWSVRGDSSVDLRNYTGPSLESDALSGLPGRDNPYTVSCQANDGKSVMGAPATFQVRVAKTIVRAPEMRTERVAAGDEYGRAPNTDDASVPIYMLALLAAACLSVLFCVVLTHCRIVCAETPPPGRTATKKRLPF